MSVPNDERWMSAHLFFPGPIYGGWADRIVLEVVQPFIREAQRQTLVRRWFFIRYSEHGPHLRLRCLAAHRTIEAELRPMLESFLRSRDVGIVEGIPLSPHERLFPSPAEQASVSLRRYAWVPYVAEVNRYGGPEALCVAEEMFEHSSEFVATVLRQIGVDSHRRLACALVAMVAFLHAFFEVRQDLADFARDYSAGYLRSVAGAGQTELASEFDAALSRQADGLSRLLNDVWERLADGDPLTDELDEFHARAVSVRDRLHRLCEAGRVDIGNGPSTFDRAGRAIVASYLHMTNNRMGVSVPEESYLSHLVFRTLGTAPHSTASVAPVA